MVETSIQNDIRIVEDNDGGCIIAWKDGRSGDTGDIYAMHILSDARPDPNWQRNGRPVVIAAGGQISHSSDEDADGGMIIAWQDGRNDRDVNIWAQRITPAGELLWGNDEGIMVCTNRESQEYPKLRADGNGSAFITWTDYRGNSPDIYVQRVNADGRLLWGDGGAPLVTQEGVQTNSRIILIEAGYAIVFWEDAGLYGMKIGGVDKLERYWQPANGKQLISDEARFDARLCADGEGGAYIAWSRELENGFFEDDIYAQRIDRNGDPSWNENGNLICDAYHGQKFPKIDLLSTTGETGILAVWEDKRSSSKQETPNLYCQRIDDGYVSVERQEKQPPLPFPYS